MVGLILLYWYFTKDASSQKAIESNAGKSAEVTVICFSSALNIPKEPSSRVRNLPPAAQEVYDLWSRHLRPASWAASRQLRHPDEPVPKDNEETRERFEKKLASLNGKESSGAVAFLSLVVVETSAGESFALAQRMGVAFHEPIEKAPGFPFLAPAGMSRLKTGEWRMDSRTHDTTLCRTLFLIKPSELIEKQKLLQAVSETTSIAIENISLKTVSGL
jgi:hypothetical protein